MIGKKCVSNLYHGGRRDKTFFGIMSATTVLGAIALCPALTSPVAAQDAWPTVPDETMTALEAPDGNVPSAAGVSADGSVIVGSAQNANFQSSAVAWYDGNITAIDLGTLGADLGTTPGSLSSANLVSSDGSVIVGSALNTNGNFSAVSWAAGNTIPTELGTLSGGDTSVARAVSADGNVIVGASENTDGDNRAVSWANGSITPTDLGTLGGDSNALAVNADGSIIIGNSKNNDDNTRGVSWVNGNTTPTELETLGGDNSFAVAVSADSNVIIGFSDNTDQEQRAVSWADGSTAPTELGTLLGDDTS